MAYNGEHIICTMNKIRQSKLWFFFFFILLKGSRICAACPAGYDGDGVTCNYVGSCQINNGGCHASATCIEHPAFGNMNVQCRCPEGYQGSGIGPDGCRPVNHTSVSTTCSPLNCINGNCVPIVGGLRCLCAPGFTGKIYYSFFFLINRLKFFLIIFRH